MKRKDYEKPTMKVVPVRMSQMLCASPGVEVTNTANWGYGNDTTDEVYF